MNTLALRESHESCSSRANQACAGKKRHLERSMQSRLSSVVYHGKHNHRMLTRDADQTEDYML